MVIYGVMNQENKKEPHENKRNIEKYIHLIYITFAPLLFFTFFDSTEDYFIPPLYIVIFILTLPLFFLFKNLYLYYRNKRLNKLQLEERSLREYITKIIEELTTLIKHPKDLVSNEEKYESVSSLDKIPDFIKCIIAGIIVGIVAGFSAGIIVDFSVGFIVGIVAGFLAGFLADTSAGSAKYAIVDTSIGFLVGAIAGLLASVFIDVFAGLLASVFIGLMTSFIVGTIIRFAKYTNTDSAKCAIVKAITATIAGAITSSIIGASIGYIFYNRLF